jgi:hypothetical protein
VRRYRTKSKIKFRTGLGLNTCLQRVYSRAQKRRNKNNGNNDEQGIIIVLVAVFMLGAVGAMAALSIDVVTLYTARSEAQLAADAGALAAARALANSGATSYATGTLMSNAEPMATKVAIQVAQNSLVGGRNLVAANGEVTVSFSDSENTPCVALKPVTNPCVTVAVQRNDLPTFFARIWGSRQIKVTASATAEAYNPTNTSGVSNSNPPVAPTCVKPWLLPNISPPSAPAPIFNAVTGAISDPSLLGYPSPDGGGGLRLRSAVPPTVTAWRYYAGDPADFPPPSASSVVCSGCSGFTNPNYQLSIAGCVQKPIACNQTVHLDVNPDPNRDDETRVAVNGLTHASSDGAGDSVQPEPDPPQGGTGGTAPFQFLAGSKNPLVLSGTVSAEADVMVSDSLVTVPVIDTTNLTSLPQVQIIGFLQLFLNPDGEPASSSGPNANQIRTTVINMVGCGNGASGTVIPPILGNGASPVAVRLISH